MTISLLDSFGSLDQAIKDVIADIDSPRSHAFVSLYLAKKLFHTDSLSSEYIIACLESAGVAVSKKSIGRSLASAKGFVTRKIDDDGEVFYRLMIKGEREAEKLLQSMEKLVVLRVEGDQPRQARRKLGEVLKTMKGLVRVCDPFYGVSTLDSLDLIPSKCEVRFLSQKTNEPTRRIDGALRDFYKERPKTEIRVAPPSSRLHDRYIIAEQQILILGHGIKDIGNKESFIIILDKKLVPDLIKEITSFFDQEWNTATKI